MDAGPFTPDEEPPPDERQRRRWFGMPSTSDLSPEVRREMEAARAEPGPSWREWFLFSGSKWWIGLGFFIVDAWILVGAYQGQGLALTLGLFVVALYLEVVLYEYLWYRPAPSRSLSAAARPLKWIRPVAVGRWTPEAEAMRAGRELPEGTPDAREFL